MMVTVTCVGIETTPPGDPAPRTILHLHAGDANTRFSIDGADWAPLLRIERRDPSAAGRFVIGAAYELELGAATPPDGP